jgi:hypothetical protein
MKITIGDIDRHLQLLKGYSCASTVQVMSGLIIEQQQDEIARLQVENKRLKELAEKYRLEMIRCGKGWEKELKAAEQRVARGICEYLFGTEPNETGKNYVAGIKAKYGVE